MPVPNLNILYDPLELCAKRKLSHHWPWLSGVPWLQPPFLDSALKNQVTILPSRNTEYPAFILVSWLWNRPDLDSLWLRGLFPWPHCYQFHSFLNSNYPNPLINRSTGPYMSTTGPRSMHNAKYIKRCSRSKRRYNHISIAPPKDLFSKESIPLKMLKLNGGTPYKLFTYARRRCRDIGTY